MPTTFFFESNNLLGQGDMPTSIPLRLGFIERVLGTAFFCPECGDVWGRICATSTKSFLPVIRRCRQHGNGVFLMGDKIWTHYPKEILIHDFCIISSSPAKPFYAFIYDWQQTYD